MNFSLTELFNSLSNYWKKLTRPQQMVLVLAPLVVALSLFSLIFWASRPHYIQLFNKLSASEAGAITAKLKELNVQYQLAENGSTILVPEKQVSEVRLQLANEGLPQQSTFSFQNLDQMRLGETDKDFKLRFILGLQNELEQTIQTLDGVEYARVHIVMPEDTLFSTIQKDTTAAVTIKKAYGSQLGEDQVRAIANLLAYSVEGLAIGKVTIVDTNGNVLSDFLGESTAPYKLSSNQLQLQQTVEENIQKSVQSMLDRVFGTGITIVRANASIDFDQKKITSQISEEGAVVSRQQTTERSSNQTGETGVPGVDPNVPGYEFPADAGTASSSEKTSLTENFEPSIIQEEKIVSPGQIKRLTVSVMADSDSVTEEQLDNIENIVIAAGGMDINRGDLIQVARLPFNKTSILEEQAAIADAIRKDQYLYYAQIAGGALALVIFFILLMRIRSKRNEGFGALEVAGGQQLVTLQEAEQLLASQMEAERQAELKLARKKAKTSEEIEKEKIKKEVEKYTRDNPDDVAKLVKTWLTEEQ